MGDHRAPDTGQIPRPGPVAPSTEPIKAPVQTPVDTNRGLPPELTAVDPRIMEDSGGKAKRPEPVLDAARVAGAISAVILAIGGLLKLVGIVVPDDYDLQPLADQAATAVLAVAGAWTVVGPWITARIRARDRVTPLADPRDAYGRRLTPEES